MKWTCVALVIALGACGEEARVAPAERFRARGKIVGMTADEVDVHHERIAAVRGFDGALKPMASMTMPFARERVSFAGLAVGDVVAFEFTVHYDADPTLRLVAIEELPAGTVLELR